MTVVDHTRDSDLTAQGNQAARSRALTHLLELPGMPTVSAWIIDATNNTLVGTLLTEPDEDPTELRRKVQAWADFLHVAVTEGLVGKTITLRVEGRCDYGVPVRIYTSFPAIAREAAA